MTTQNSESGDVGGAPSSGAVDYPVVFNVERAEKLNRLTTLFRIILVIPIAIILGIVAVYTATGLVNSDGNFANTSGYSAIAAGLGVATALMILFRQKYPRWWFDFQMELQRFSLRVTVYALALRDEYPSTDEKQAVTLEIPYPDVEKDLKRWMPLVKWFLAIPHYIVLAVLGIFGIFVAIIGWFAVLITGRYPEPLFNYIVGIMRYWLRVWAYVGLLATDKYPPFSLN